MNPRWTTPALRDLEAIGDYVARDDPSAADWLVTAVLQQAESLSVHPHLGRAGRVPETRELVIAGAPYVLAYRVRGGDVEILAALHGARRWPAGFD